MSVEVESFQWEVTGDPHTRKVFLSVNAYEDGDPVFLSLEFDVINVGRLVHELLEASKVAVGIGQPDNS